MVKKKPAKKAAKISPPPPRKRRMAEFAAGRTAALVLLLGSRVSGIRHCWLFSNSQTKLYHYPAGKALDSGARV